MCRRTASGVSLTETASAVDAGPGPWSSAAAGSPVLPRDVRRTSRRNAPARLVEEAEELVVHDRVPKEAGIPKDGEPVPRDGNGHHQDEPESCVERAQGGIKGPGTKIAGADLGHGDHAPREEQGEGAL